jgi:hypothetical protein
MAIKPIKPSGYPAIGQAFGRARACLGNEDHWVCDGYGMGLTNVWHKYHWLEIPHTFNGRTFGP